MKKVWFFVEGDSEEKFVKKLILSGIILNSWIEKDLLSFIKKNPADLDKIIFYVDNCESIDRIPHRINEINYLIEKAGSINIIVCDLENFNCFSERKRKILSILEPEVNIKRIHFVFSKPIIEAEYWNHPELIIRIVEKDFQLKFNRAIKIQGKLNTTTTKWLDELKKIFKMNGLKYRKTHFAEEFFSRIDFKTTSSQLVQRARTLLNNIVSEK